MSAAAFTIRYDGPALASHRMAVKDLAPALLALGEAVNAAGRIANPASQPPSLAITASEEGSFKVNLDLIDASFFEKVQNIFSGDAVSAAVNAAELVGWVIAGVQAVKWLHRRRVTVQADTPTPGWIRITDADGTSIDLPSGVYTLIQDAHFRLAAQDVVEPLRPDVVDVVEIERGDEIVRVTADEKAAFSVPDQGEELVLDEERVAVLRLTSVTFQEGNKWRVTEGDLNYWVNIEDDDFLRKVRDGREQFGAGDSLRVTLHTLQWDTAEGLKAERTIKKVLEHRRGARQIPLPFADESDGLSSS